MKSGVGIAGTVPGRAEPQTEQRFSLREAARILEVPEARLRALARAGFLAPQRGPIGPLSFGFQDLILLRTTKGLLEAGVPMRRIRTIWSSLRAQLTDDLPLTSISIHTDGEAVVASDGSVLWQPDSGQFILDFEASEIAERAVEAPELAVLPEPATGEGLGGRPTSGVFTSEERRPPSPLTVLPGGAVDADLSADEWYEEGCELESSSPERAFEAYQRALELDPSIAGAHVNLGRQLHIAGELGRAEPHYREAVRLDPDDPTPHHNLGVLLEELGRKDEAVHAYRQAILRDPDFADAHCNLGLLLESLGRRQEAVRHLMAARKLSGEPE
ncbi:MAG TPA: tetratricopeptide repeat protein [Candidatus Eisenbacteria bacterium]|nr:tetratricopeptide repeat protein [Candidatus Eisenbacteria bacterium]